MSENTGQDLQEPADTNSSSGFFKGRMSRTSFFLRMIPLIFLAIILRVMSVVAAYEYGNQEVPILILIVSIPLTIYVLSCYVRRWHDLNQSWICVLLLLLPLINLIIMLLLFILPGTTGPNRFGPAPN
jgi:uncharacterized membrane protein YhaH (DUF805 family)